MRHLIYSFFAVICAAAPALACEPPDFPKPEDVTNLEMIDSRQGQLTEVEKVTLDSYLADRQRFIELYDQAYPCPLAATDEDVRLQAANSEAMVEEINKLKSKWDRSETLPAKEDAPEESEFIDVPDDEMTVVE
ncbi:MAG TPA: hypothetical protein VIF12_08700 [Micavibrio sp.]